MEGRQVRRVEDDKAILTIDREQGRTPAWRDR